MGSEAIVRTLRSETERRSSDYQSSRNQAVPATLRPRRAPMPRYRLAAPVARVVVRWPGLSIYS